MEVLLHDMMKRVPCTQVSERRLLIVSINLSLMCPLCQAMTTLTTVMNKNSNPIASISCLMLIVLFNRMHYQNREGKSPSTRRAAAPKILVQLVESLGVRSTRGSVRLPIGVFDSLLSYYGVYACASSVRLLYPLCARGSDLEIDSV